MDADNAIVRAADPARRLLRPALTFPLQERFPGAFVHPAGWFPHVCVVVGARA